MVQCVHVVLNKALEHAVEEKADSWRTQRRNAKSQRIPAKEMNILPEALIGPYPERSERAWDSCADVSGTDHRLAAAGNCWPYGGRTWTFRTARCPSIKALLDRMGKLVISTPKTPNSIRTVLLHRYSKASCRGARKTPGKSVFVHSPAHR